MIRLFLEIWPDNEPAAPVTGADLLSRIFDQLKRLGQLDSRHFRLVITNRLTKLDLSNFYHNEWSCLYTDIVLRFVQLKQPVGIT